MTELIKHTSKLWERRGEVRSSFLFWCPGCGRGHTFDVPRWNFDGNLQRPTFSPSLRVFIPAGEGRPNDETVCHLFVTTGRIIYCADSPHDLKGKEVDLPEIPENYGF